MRMLYYSGSSTHPYFLNEFKQMSKKFDLTPSNPSYVYQSGFKSGQKEIQRSSLKLKFRYYLLKILIFLGWPKVQPISVKEDLIWSCGYLLKSNKPYVVTFEDVSVFYFHSFNRLNKFISSFIIRLFLESKNCKAIIPWTKAAERSLFSVFDSKKIKLKTKVIFPAIEPKISVVKQNTSQKIHVLFDGTSFLRKGGWETYLACKDISNVHLHMLYSFIPGELLKKIKKDKNVTLYTKITNEEKEGLYKKADFFVLPTHMDTLGFVFFEAMSYGLPCISTNHFAVPEIINDGDNGFVIDNYCSYFDMNYLHKYDVKTIKNFENLLKNPPASYILNLKKKIELLANDSKLRLIMSKNSLDKVKTGKFSIVRKQNKIENLIR